MTTPGIGDPEPGEGRHGPIRTTKRMTHEEVLARMKEKGIDPEHPFRGMTIESDEELKKLSPAARRMELDKRKKREIGDYQAALQEASSEAGVGMPKIYSYSSIARTAAVTMHNTSEEKGKWDLGPWWEWIHVGQTNGLLTMDDDEVEQTFLVDPKGYNLIWDWIHQYEATTGKKIEPNYTINLRGGVQRGPITGSKVHYYRELFEDPTFGYGTEGLPDTLLGEPYKEQHKERPITIDPNDPKYRHPRKRSR